MSDEPDYLIRIQEKADDGPSFFVQAGLYKADFNLPAEHFHDRIIRPLIATIRKRKKQR